MFSFVFCVFRRGSVSRNKFGRYIGAVLLGTFMIATLCNAFHPDLWHQVGVILGLIIAANIIISIFENLNRMYSIQMIIQKQRSTAGHPDLDSTLIRSQSNVKAVRLNGFKISNPGGRIPLCAMIQKENNPSKTGSIRKLAVASVTIAPGVDRNIDKACPFHRLSKQLGWTGIGL